MSQLKVLLFGKLSVRCNKEPVQGLTGSKVQELFCYLLLHRDRPHPRETLAGLLWGDIPTVQSKKYLRQALWQLQTGLNGHGISCGRDVLRIEPDWVGVNAEADLWLDVAVFEKAYSLSREMTCSQMDAARALALRSAVDLYQGDLLEGWYQDWCLYERQRLQDMYLAMLDTLIGYNEGQQEYEAGRAYGMRILRRDPAREATHQRLMRLHYLAGDRAGALRQYGRCVAALQEELGVPPSESTVGLYEQIRAGRLDGAGVPLTAGTASPVLSDVLGRLKQLEVTLADFRHRVQKEIQVVENALTHKIGPAEGERRHPPRALPVSAPSLLRARPGRQRAG